MKNLLTSVSLASLLGISVLTTPVLAEEQRATAEMIGLDGTKIGTVELIQLSDRVLLKTDIGGLEPGLHGFHIHETGACSPDFKAAGGHFNPDHTGHGYAGHGGHAGDLSNLVALESGRTKAETFATAVTLAKGHKNSVFDADGSAIVVHAKADVYGEKAGAGARVACGVIKPAS